MLSISVLEASACKNMHLAMMTLLSLHSENTTVPISRKHEVRAESIKLTVLLKAVLVLQVQ